MSAHGNRPSVADSGKFLGIAASGCLAGAVATFDFETPSVGRVRQPGARYRLLCLPFPGAGASAFLPWADELPPDVELSAIQLAGREDRFLDEPSTSVDAIVAELVEAITPTLDCPVALFGHSGGALLAYELARALPDPIHLFVSAEPPPEAPRPDMTLHDLDDAAFTDRVKERGGMAPEIAGNAELMELLLPTLRADFTWYGTYRYHQRAQLGCPITAFASPDDPLVAPADLAGWAAHTTGPSQIHLVDGGHFFVRDAAGTIVTRIVESLRTTATT